LDSWRSNPRVFGILAGPGTFWLLIFFLIPLGYLFLMSFGEKTSITDVAITGTLTNYIRSFDAVYLPAFATTSR
jgi:spermidine/putrescine transport system permease protein